MTRKRNPAEALCFWALVLTWPFYGVGALYIVGPVLGWSLLGMVTVSAYLGPAMRADLRIAGPIPLIVWSWIAGILAMLVVLWIGHLDWDLGTAETIKSSIGWAKGWALAALFPLAGAVLPIRREPLIRAMCVVGLHTLILLPFLVAAAFIHLPSSLFVSPLSVIGGPGPEYFEVFLYTVDPETLTPRWQFYLPWSPFAGLIGVTVVLFALEERKRAWTVCGVLAGVAMIVLSSSRMSVIALVVCVAIPRIAPLFRLPATWLVSTVAATSMAVFGNAALGLVETSMSAFKSARVSSSRVRDTLQRIAFDRWRREAPLFGHGAVERGPHIVEYMPIGSHHTWFGLLYVKGLFGLLSLLAPMVYQFGLTMLDATRHSRGRLPFGIMLLMVQLTFGENMEIETYMFWPAFMILGIHAREAMLAGRAARVARAASPVAGPLDFGQAAPA
jgi:hypothetical protein